MATYGLSTWLVSRTPMDEAIEKVVAAGFRDVELSADYCPIVEAWEADPVATCQRLATAGLAVPSIHSPEAGRHLDIADGAARQASIDVELACFEKMVASGIPEIIIHPTSVWSLPEGDSWDALRARSVESLKRLADRAGQEGLRMAVENLGKEPSPAATIGGILNMIGGLGDHVGVCHDVGHTVQAGLDVLSETKTALDSGKLFSLHLHDVDADNRDHYIPGEGCVDLGPVIAELNARDFSGGRTLEVSPPESNVDERISMVADVRRDWEAR